MGEHTLSEDTPEKEKKKPNPEGQEEELEESDDEDDAETSYFDSCTHLSLVVHVGGPHTVSPIE